jgi:hypothetical protein
MFANRRGKWLGRIGFVSVVLVLITAIGGDAADARQLNRKAVAKQRARQAARVQAAIRQFQQAATKNAAQAADAPKAKRDSAPAANRATAVAGKTAERPVVAKQVRVSSVRPEFAIPSLKAAEPSAAAAEADRLLKAAISQIATAAASIAGDQVFLRRVSLDLAGRLPTPEEITAFSLDPASDKRSGVVERLLAEEAYGENWGRYWRDVIMYRRADDRARLAAPALESYLSQRFNENTPWDEIARSFITATGDVRENGATAIFMAQMGETSDITAEISRIFIGIQIQCAQCHNHPTDRWQRAQFHELAAFFPRIAVRPKRSDEVRSFEVASADSAPRVRRPNAGQARGSLEHYMPELDNPTARGTLMEPVFFVTGQKLATGSSDKQRRETIARWITSRSNPWFAKAFVNRLWSELVGEGFYEPVDDLGPDREATASAVLDYLAAQFAANKYDVKWLFRTITATEAYQRESRSRHEPGETPMLANVPQRLRADQLYTALTSILGAPLGRPGARARQAPNLRNPRNLFASVFGYDPSTPRDEVAGAIPQALLLMNSTQFAVGMDSDRPQSLLGKLLSQQSDDSMVAVELYLRTLSREPAPDELATCLAQVKGSTSRGEGFEDVLWALLNSAEFLYRR